MTSQAVMKRYLTAVSKTEEYANNKTIQNLATAIANFKKLEKEEQAELNVLIEGAYKKLQAKGFSVKKTPTRTTTTRKTRTTSQGGLKAILAELKKKLGSEKFKEATTGTDIQKDIKIPALKKGKRIVRKKGYTTNQYGTFKNQVGTAYWESRANRFDANQPSQTRKYKLADGGQFESLKVGSKVGFLRPQTGRYEYAEVLSIDGNNVNLVARHPKRSQWDNYFSETKERISKFLNTPSEDWKDGRPLLKIKYADGGKVGIGDMVNLPEIKMRDGRVQYERVVGGEVIGFEDGIYDVLNPKTNRIHRVSENQIEKPSAYSKHRQTASRMRSDEDTYPKGTEFAKGGITEHGLKNGDKIVSAKVVGTTIRVRNESLDEDARVDLNTGKRTLLTYDKKSKNWVEKMADGGNTSKLTEAEREQAEREIREAWEGKNADDYIMYSDKYKKGGETDEGNFIYRDYYKGQGIKFQSEEDAKEFIKLSKPFLRKQLKEGNLVLMYNGKEYFIAEKVMIDDYYAKGGTTKRIKRKSC